MAHRVTSVLAYCSAVVIQDPLPLVFPIRFSSARRVLFFLIKDNFHRGHSRCLAVDRARGKLIVTRFFRLLLARARPRL